MRVASALEEGAVVRDEARSRRGTRPATSRAMRSPRCRDGWSARRAAAASARRRARGRAARGAASRPTASSTGASAGRFSRVEHPLDALLERPAVPLFELVLQSPELGELGGPAALSDGDGRMVIRLHEIAAGRQALQRRRRTPAVGGERHVLAQARSREPRRAPDRARIRQQLARQGSSAASTFRCRSGR